jgi:6-phosphofructokinase
VAVVGVPKTIDNDILLMDKTFGFDTAVEEAQRAINSAYIEVLYMDFTCPCMELCFFGKVFLLNSFPVLVSSC